MARASRPTGLEGALDELYGVDPAEFVATRKRLAAGLRAATEAEAAKELAAARRPTNAAWALNQLVRRHPMLVERFLLRSRELQLAQDRAVSGKGDALRDATRSQRQALAAATEAAIAVLGDDATDAYRTQIAATLQAASVDEETADGLQKGRLTREVSGSSGFPDTGSLSVAPAPKSTRASPSQKSADKPETQASRARRERAEAELAAAEASLRTAKDAIASAEKSAEAANARVEDLRNELDDARQEARAATVAVQDARRMVKERTNAVDRLRAQKGSS